MTISRELLQQLLRQKEGLKLDFKQELKLYSIPPGKTDMKTWKEFVDGQWNELIKDILALANGNLGTGKESAYLIVGASDKLSPSGSRELFDTSQLDITEQQILNKVNSVCNPPLPNLQCEKIELEGKLLTVITIPFTPYIHEITEWLRITKGHFDKSQLYKSFIDKTYTDGTVFIRRGEDIRPARHQERIAIANEKSQISQDLNIAPKIYSEAQPFAASEKQMELFSDLYHSIAEKITKTSIFITPELLTSSHKSSNNVVVGKTINLAQAMNNSFMERTALLNEAIFNIDEHVKQNASTRNSYIVTFWIDGKSGSGKSVLLIQLLQHFVLKRNAKVFWLANDHVLLERLVLEWENAEIESDEPVYIFLDDFFAPQTRDDINFRSITKVINDVKNQNIKWPVLITCSPPEYFAEFQASGNDEVFLSRHWTIPLVGSLEQEALYKWFEQRTGKSPTKGPAFSEENTLILSLMFELQYGDMREFGRRFKTRLDNSGLTEAMIHPLALNRLYIWPPREWINDISLEQRESLAIINKEQDFSFLSTDDDKNEYIRITHPHLSDAVYKAIRPQSGGILWADDLANAFERALKYDDVLASRILRTIAIGGDRVDELNNDHLANNMSKIWRSYENQINQSHPIGMAFIWTNWACWAARFPKVKSVFSPLNLLDKAINQLDYNHPYWDELWLQLWSSYKGNSRLIQIALHWLSMGNYFDPSWYYVWQMLLNSANDQDSKMLSELLSIGIHRLHKFSDYRWSYIWEILVEYEDKFDKHTYFDLLTLGIDWLNGREDLNQWTFVWQGILRQHRHLPLATIVKMIEKGIVWLEEKGNSAQWTFVWQDLVKYEGMITMMGFGDSRIKLIIKEGFNWLQEHEQLNDWPFIWKIVASNHKQLDDETQRITYESGLRWLYSHRESNYWPKAYKTVLSLKSNEPELLHLGLEWIEENIFCDKGIEILTKLTKSYLESLSKKDLHQLAALTKIWVMKISIQDEKWFLIWLAYWRLMPTMETASIGLKWIEMNSPHHKTSGFILKHLMKTERSDLRCLICDWSERHPDHNSLLSGYCQ